MPSDLEFFLEFSIGNGFDFDDTVYAIFVGDIMRASNFSEKIEKTRY